MNKYKLVIFDGWKSRTVIASGSDMYNASLNVGVSMVQVIKAELIGSVSEENLS